MSDVIVPDWPAPPGVRAVSTLRGGGVSRGPYESLNLALHVGDDAQSVLENRRRLRAQLALGREPAWLKQVHGIEVARAAQASAPVADAMVTDERGVACAILTADCLPVLFASADGKRVAAAHAGWRGLSRGVLEATIAALATPPRELLAWLGPGIGPARFEVGAEVREAFLRLDPAAVTAFSANQRHRWQADLYRLARQHLNRAGIDAVYGGGWCTYDGPERFFSYRRDGECGRMATLVWIE